MEDRVLNIFRKQNNTRWPVAPLLVFLDFMLKSILFSKINLARISGSDTLKKSNKVALISVLF